MRNPILLGLLLIMVLGLWVYFKLWSIDSEFSQEDRELIRRQFDLANREAMDESAEWRFKYDVEIDKATKCAMELTQAKEALQSKTKEVADINRNLDILQKENIGLLDRVESLTHELQTKSLNCS
ncbi:acyl-CoA-binding domain protein [Thalictrum thalictroides]|uniref:Acyl-CoA-binding domain protein n=1 Tax=Thalictrum thalictroides TaxID=46969 RepID=A0A7J6WDM9_THATH|nr:acyl-CoA-binding domain protein [Thalictrum thalictroides]